MYTYKQKQINIYLQILFFFFKKNIHTHTCLYKSINFFLNITAPSPSISSCWKRLVGMKRICLVFALLMKLGRTISNLLMENILILLLRNLCIGSILILEHLCLIRHIQLEKRERVECIILKRKRKNHFECI